MLAFDNFIINCYHSRRSGTFSKFSNRYALGGINISRFNTFNTYMKINLNSDKLELPCVYKYILTDALHNNIYASNPIQELYIPMFCQSSEDRELKTSNSAFRMLFYDSSPIYNLTKINVGGVTYFGSEGLILNADFTPLIMLTLEVERKEIEGRIKYAPIKQLIRINPIVYLTNDILSKYIKTKVISNILQPTHTGNIYLRDHYGIFTKTQLDWTFKIVIEDFSSFFCHPIVPDVKFTDEAINEMLSEGIEDILKE